MNNFSSNPEKEGLQKDGNLTKHGGKEDELFGSQQEGAGKSKTNSTHDNSFNSPLIRIGKHLNFYQANTKLKYRSHESEIASQ